MKYVTFVSIALIVLVIIVYAFFVRPYHMHWGATEEERAKWTYNEYHRLGS
ncbi:MAG: hypothetical protein OIN83_10355 [Candidatus Methanoperedens sp.]|nr:hypothetical protein [Candidatus Methanoperedens sp.]